MFAPRSRLGWQCEDERPNHNKSRMRPEMGLRQDRVTECAERGSFQRGTLTEKTDFGGASAEARRPATLRVVKVGVAPYLRLAGAGDAA